MGQRPETLKAARYKAVAETSKQMHRGDTQRQTAKTDLGGVELFLDRTSGPANDLGDSLSKLRGDGSKLEMISNRGVKVWPGGHAETFCSDHWRCRFLAETDGGKVSHPQIISLLKRVADKGFDFIKIENLYNFDGERGYSLDQ